MRRSPLRSLARAAIRGLLRQPRLFAVVDREMSAMRRPAPDTEPTAASVSAPAAQDPTFVDRHGTVHTLQPGHRDKWKPQWRTMCDPVSAAAQPTDAALRARAKSAEKVVEEASRLVAAVAGRPLEGRILEVGCSDGSAAYVLARNPRNMVVGSDLARYCVVQRPHEPSDRAVAEQQVILAQVRDRAAGVAGVPPERVRFVEDDVTASRLEPGSFDAIVSFEVLEHVADPFGTMAAIGRLLVPGGVTYHDYNPFFAINGGHSLCTLDMPWGHARLDRADVVRYLTTIRAAEADQALRFYDESLNRMTMAELRESVVAAGLELLAVIPWHARTLLETLTPEVVTDVRRAYPSARPEDLLGTFVSVVARKPGT